jgi:hypothetical protein
MRVHLRSLFLLLVVDLLFFHQLVLSPTDILYSPHSDLIAEHIPAKRFLVRSYQETGELPLWNPHHFAGSPFVHDIQVAMFYPPHLALLLLPEEAIGAALSWLVVLHVLLAGWLMYAYACHRGLPPVPAFIAGVGFMLGGRWLMHLLGGGHYILIGLAWLPLVLLAWEKAIAGKGWVWGVLAGVAYALLTLSTQPQWTFYSGLFGGVWTFGVVLDQAENRRRAVLRWLGFGVMLVAITVGLTAIQLLPTLEAAGQSSRSGGVGSQTVLQNGLNVLLFLVGPALSDQPFNLQWEDRGGLAMLWLIVAVWAPVLRKGRTRYEAAVCAGLFLFAMGGAIVFQALPGFNLFRQPARMAVIATLPIAWLAAVAVQARFAPDGLTPEQTMSCQRWVIRVGVASWLLMGGFVVRQMIEGHHVIPHVYLILAAVLPVVAWRMATSAKSAGSLILASWLVIDGLVMNWSLPQSHSDVYNDDLPPWMQKVASAPGNRVRVLDADFPQLLDSVVALGSGAPLALIAGVDAVRGYSPLDVLRYREYLQFMAGSDQPLRALDSTFTYPVIGRFHVANSSLLHLLGVRYVIVPSSLQQLWRLGGGNRNLKAANLTGGVYDFLEGGVQSLTVDIQEMEVALPRAFVVTQAKPLPKRSEILRSFESADFGAEVYLEEFDEASETHPAGKHDVKIRSYQPNRVVLESNGQMPGFLVLTDVWFPGWKCTIDGEETKIYRANYCFRGVKLPAGAHTIEFRFEPESYRRGRTITFASLGVVAFLALLGGFMALRTTRVS